MRSSGEVIDNDGAKGSRYRVTRQGQLRKQEEPWRMTKPLGISKRLVWEARPMADVSSSLEHTILPLRG